MAENSLRAVRARWIVPVSSPPIAHGVLTLAGQRIVSVGENTSGQPARELGDVAILPSLVNPHVHLEFSGLDAPLGRPRQGFAAWIRDVIDWRREWRAACPNDAAIAEQRTQDVRRGLDECRRAGVGAMGEIATPDWPVEPFRDSAHAPGHERPAPDATVFLELLGLSTARREPLLQLARQHVERRAPDTPWHAGWSPHAPYTTHVELVRTICQWSDDMSIPVTMHLAESIDEIELLQSHSGPLVELLRELDAWDPAAIPRGIRPLDYLDLLATAHRALVIHGNFLGPRDWNCLAAARDRMTVVYCPRTHDYFGHGDYPLEAMLEAGVRVAVGTDSRASNPDLRLWSDLRFVRHRYPNLSPRTILEFGTLAAAEALGRGADLGSLEPAKLAALLVVPLSDSGATDIEEQLLAAE